MGGFLLGVDEAEMVVMAKLDELELEIGSEMETLRELLGL